MKNNDKKTGETNNSIRAMSVKSEINIVRLQSFYSRKQLKIYDCLSPSTIKSTPFPINRSISSSVALCRDLEGNIRITATVYPPHAIILSSLLVERP